VDSPTKISESGATILTGRGVDAVRRKFAEAFQQIRQHPAVQHPAQPAPHVEPTPPQTPLVYTEQHEERFHKRAKKLALDALTSSHIATTRSFVVEITVPTETAEELFKAALGRFE
jgi:hypothetical protein